MEDFLSNQFTWFSFLLVAAGLLALYFLLRVVRRLLAVSMPKKRFELWAEKFIHDLLTLFEPLAVILLSSIFIFINPPFHGLLIALLVFAGFSHVKNYLSGRFVHLDRSVSKGKRLKTGQTEGVISKLGNLGLHLQTPGGPHHVSYSTLLNEGYTLVSGEESGGFCHLRITLAEDQKTKPNAQQLFDLLATTPFLDWNYKPEMVPSDGENAGSIEAKFLLKDEKYLHDLQRLMNEWGFLCQMATGGKQ